VTGAPKFASLLLLIAFYSSQPAYPQSKAKHDPYANLAKQDSGADLAAVADWQSYTPPILPDPAPKVSFHLQTSWIPGDQHRGTFRYRLNGAIFASAMERAKSPESYTPASIATTIKQIHACDITLVMYDRDGFVLRKIAVPFAYGVNEQSEIISLSSNDATQMDVSEYRRFSSWTLSWSCAGI
jgi:hypothetical protein